MIDSAHDASEIRRSVRMARARAEFAEWETILGDHEAGCRNLDPGRSPLAQLVERNAVTMEIAHDFGLSESQLFSRVAIAARLRDHTPRTWMAWSNGRIDAARAREISHATDKLQRHESIERLDARVIDYAETHTVSELKGWLRRFVLRVEGDLAVERAEAEREHRHIEVVHGDDGMGYLTIYDRSIALAAIENRLNKGADAFGTDDPRTKAQRRADLAVAWLTANDGTEATLTPDIAVMIGADVLAGATEGFGLSADGTWGAPAAWIAELAGQGDPFWHRMIVDPITGDALAFESSGRFATGTLAKAIQFRDGVCRAPGCLKAAEYCDIDHRRPWPDGHTSGDNLWALCRRHHSMKGHGVLKWVLHNTEITADGIEKAA